MWFRKSVGRHRKSCPAPLSTIPPAGEYNGMTSVPLLVIKQWLCATALSFCLFMLIMLIMLIIRSFVYRQRVLVGQRPDWPSRAIVLGPWAAAALLGNQDRRCLRCYFLREKLHPPGELYARDGGLLVASRNAPRSWKFRDDGCLRFPVTFLVPTRQTRTVQTRSGQC